MSENFTVPDYINCLFNYLREANHTMAHYSVRRINNNLLLRSAQAPSLCSLYQQFMVAKETEPSCRNLQIFMLSNCRLFRQ